MKLKIIMAIAGIAIVGSSIIVIVQSSERLHKKSASPEGVESELPTAISNYARTFKLNTNQPIWTIPANGRSATN